MTLTNENDFFQALENWKNTVAKTCHNLATNSDYKLDLDFYVFQSSVQFEPPLLMIGANPGGEKSYSGVLDFKNEERKLSKDLGYDTNQFLANPQWGSNSICKLFSGSILRPMFENAVITNLVYFNTKNFKRFTSRKGAREALDFCKNANKELIAILQPKNVILLGNTARYGMEKFFDKPIVPVLKSIDGKSILIGKTSINSIPTYHIHHPSMNKKFNTGKNLELKKNQLEELL